MTEEKTTAAAPEFPWAIEVQLISFHQGTVHTLLFGTQEQAYAVHDTIAECISARQARTNDRKETVELVDAMGRATFQADDLNSVRTFDRRVWNAEHGRLVALAKAEAGE